MITVQTQGEAYVGLPGGKEIYLPNYGSWQFSNVVYVASSTNADVSLPTLRSGAVVTVDPWGQVSWVDGPDLIGTSVEGFALAIVSLGVFMGIRFSIRKVLAAMSMGGLAE